MLARLHLPRLLLAFSVAFVAVVATPPAPALAAAPVVTAATLASPTDLPSSFPYQPELPEVADDPNDASINRGVIPYDEIAPKLNAWMDESDIISAQVVGQSTLGRDLQMVTITAPETPAETAQQEAWKNKIKYDSAAAKTDKALQAGYKKPIWYNSNLQGNEWEGTDASLAYIKYLLENENTPAVQEILKTQRLYFTLSANPDARVAGTRASALGFDPNRDFVTNTLPETAILRDLTTSIQPLFFVDIHGYTNVLQIEPCGPPHGENYDYDLFVPQAYAAALKIEEDVVAAKIPGNPYRSKVDGATQAVPDENSGIKIPYRDTPSGWDDWPPVFTAQYVAYQGAIAYTAELPLGRVNPSTSATNKANSAVNIKVGVQIIESTNDYVLKNGDDLLENQIEIFRRGAAGEPLRILDTKEARDAVPGPKQWEPLWGPEDYTGTTFPRAYVIPVGAEQTSATDTTYLVNYLRKQEIQVKRAKSAFTAGGKKYPKGSYIVDMHQPSRGLANALLAAGSDISNRVTEMYDISAWSNGYLWGSKVDRIGNTEDPALNVQTETVDAVTDTGATPAKAGRYLSFDLAGVDSFRALNALLRAGVKVSSIGDGTAVLGNDAASLEAAAAAAKEFGVVFTATDGSELAGAAVKPLKKLTVGWNGLVADDLTSLRQMGFGADQLVNVTAANITSGDVDLSKIDVLYLGAALSFSGTQTAGTAAMQAYINSGKGAVGRGTGANAFANTWLGAGSTAFSSNGAGNGIVALDTAKDGPLGPLDTKFGFVSPATSFALAGGTGKAVQTYAARTNPEYAKQGTLISGHWREAVDRATGAIVPNTGPDYVVGRASAFTAVNATSGAKGMVFGTSVTYRTHPRGHFSEVLTGLYWAAPAGTQAVVPPVATTTSFTIESQTFGDPGEATVKVAAATPDASRAGTVRILAGDAVLGEGVVNQFGNGKIALDPSTAAGSYALVAEYTPTPGNAVGPSVSEAVPFTVAARASTTSITATETAATVDVLVPAGLPAASGTVNVLVDGAVAASGALTGGRAVVPLPALAVGGRQVSAVYVPDAASSYLGSTSATVGVTVTKLRSSTSAKLSKSKVTTRQNGRLTVRVTARGATPTGTITVKAGRKTVKKVALKGGRASVTLPKLKAGTYRIAVSYAGSAVVNPSTSVTRTLTVVKR